MRVWLLLFGFCLIPSPVSPRPPLLVGTQTGAATVESSMKLPQKLKMELPYDPAIPLLGLYPENPRNTNLKEYMHPYVHCSVIYNS